MTVVIGDKPWIALEAIAYLEANIKGGWSTFEWGCGGSTLWFAQRTQEVISVETNWGWANAVLRAAAEQGICPMPTLHVLPPVFINLKGEYHDAEHWTEGSVATPEWEAGYAGLIDFVYPGRKFGLIVIDGGVRHLCARRALEHMLPGGLLVLDNSGNADTLPATHVLTEALGWGHRFVGPAYSATPEGECIIETGIWRMP